MKEKKKNPLLVLVVSLFVIILYFALFPHPMGKELVARPVWALDLSKAALARPSGDAETAAFELSGVFGYVTGGGELLSLNRPLFRVALTDRGFVNYSRVGTNWFFQGPAGDREFSFSGSGYPLLSADAGRLFTVQSDLKGISELDMNGEHIWSRDFSCLMTSLSLKADGLLVGLLDGTLDLVDSHGVIRAEYAPPGSRVPVILGCALSSDAGLMAAVCGIDPQTLIVLRKEGDSYKVLYHVPLSSDFRREVRMDFAPDGGCLVFEADASAGLFDPRAMDLAVLPIKGGLSSFAFMGSRGAVALLGGDRAKRELLIVKPFGSTVYRELFPAGGAFLGKIGPDLLVGVDTFLLRVGLEET